jgi:hypothetical protein
VTKLSALVPGCRVISVVQVPAKFVTVVGNSGLIMTNVPPVAPCVVGKHGSRAHPEQQQNSRNRPFHIFVLLRNLRILLNANPAYGGELRQKKRRLAALPAQLFRTHVDG